MSEEGDLCPRCEEEFANCKCPPPPDDNGLIDGWYDPEK